MNFVQWNEDNYSVNIPEIDNEHKQIVAYINELYDAHCSKENRTVLEEIIDKLIDYTNTHFQHEEELFEKYEYPEANSHIDEHNNLRTQVVQFKNDFKANKIELCHDVFMFLQLWLYNHIQESDKQYAPYLLERMK